MTTKLSKRTIECNVFVNKETLDSDLGEKALKEGVELYGEKEISTYVFMNTFLDSDEIYVEDHHLHISGDVKSGSTDVLYLSVDIPIDSKDIVPLIEYYQKQINKLKTILEATT